MQTIVSIGLVICLPQKYTLVATRSMWCPVWPDLAKFGHWGKTLIAFGYSLRVYFVFGKILTLIGLIFMILDKISLLLMAQYWKDNLAIWSHCWCPHSRARATLKEMKQKCFFDILSCIFRSNGQRAQTDDDTGRGVNKRWNKKLNSLNNNNNIFW